MKQLNIRFSRRRGVAIELAMMLFLAMTAVTIMIVNTTMIQVKKQRKSYNDLAEVIDDVNKMQKDQIGKFFISCILNEYENYSGSNEEFFIPSAGVITDYISLVFGNESFDGSGIKYEFDVKVPTVDEITINENKTNIACTLNILKQEGPIYTLTVLFSVEKTNSNQYTVTYSIVGIA